MTKDSRIRAQGRRDGGREQKRRLMLASIPQTAYQQIVPGSSDCRAASAAVIRFEDKLDKPSPSTKPR
ncbi:hypothetical protein HBI56_005790 [Parastagonospora nodorum]|uniref:Uncharacterized protein n=1 Tax=Phaeosphaeria nodorum (strain SN15 / ATCC MYA-4574 / FGSC 10173) TaxID=321614 RepID=Q0V5Q3_PHANO|nr:hypothetical protein SNOG_00661 [Parastagonospora nodorum SN15]KAH3912263.1 hypothetical protein HBH56_123880 [Parastagonospora nodorum]EAT92156.1 hypothetical protein SNOG_00661 [Parastagonospora nodorum SN15]KAH3934941.1 hypothetical protein HBH54_049420 [Parastagonospora nodorum]KAH3950300.1 hypothetical protein HBH53_079940 [Parastagonospora nodorum]KAH3987429.1 hypothetical protein HBH52_039690 [Parastagonospora nodorum]